MVVAKNKSGILAQWERDAINSGPTQRVIMAPVVSNGDFIGAEMVKAFITSDEYRHRFAAN